MKICAVQSNTASISSAAFSFDRCLPLQENYPIISARTSVKRKQSKEKKSSDLFVTLWKAKNGSNHTKRVYKKNFIWLQNAVITLQKNIRQRRLLLRAIEWLCKQAAQSFLDCLQTILKAQWPIKNKPFVLSLNDPFPVILDVLEREWILHQQEK